MSVSVTRCLLSVTCVALACVSAMSVSVENTLPATSSCVAILRGSDSLPTGTITGALLLICSALNLCVCVCVCVFVCVCVCVHTYIYIVANLQRS
jgi:hypothetical protein